MGQASDDTLIDDNAELVDKVSHLVLKPREAVAFFWLCLVTAVLMESMLADTVTDQWWYTALLRGGFAILSCLWLASDASQSKHDQVINYLVCCAIFPDITLPVYVIRTRGWLSAGLWIAKLFLVVISALFFGVMLAVIYEGVPVK